MSTIKNGAECFDFQDFLLIAGKDAPVAVNFVRNEKTLGMLHFHEFYELTVIIDGSGKYNYQGNTYVLNTGDTFIIPPGIKHWYLEQKNLSLINFIWYPSKQAVDISALQNIPGFRAFFNLEPMSRNIFNFEHKLVLPPEQLSMVQKVYRKIEAELKDGNDGYEINLSCIFIEFLIAISRFYTAKNQSSSSSNNELQKLEQVLTYLDKNYMHNIPRSKAAKIFGSCETVFYKTFQKIMSESYSSYLLNLRLQHARNLLLTTELSVSEIAIKCCFCDSNYLCYRFRNKFNISPHQFRLQQSK